MKIILLLRLPFVAISIYFSDFAVSKDTSELNTLYARNISDSIDLITKCGDKEHGFSDPEIAKLILSAAFISGESEQDAYKLVNLIVQANLWVKGISNLKVSTMLNDESCSSIMPESSKLVFQAYSEVVGIQPKCPSKIWDVKIKEKCKLVIKQAIDSIAAPPKLPE